MQKIQAFFEEARAEFRHVNWPTRAEAMRLSAVVIGMALALAVFLGAFDYVFTLGLKFIISKFITHT